MEKNAVIAGNLDSLLRVLDARAVVSLFIRCQGKDRNLFDNVPVWHILAAFPDQDVLAKYKVIGLTLGVNTSILIEKAV